ncbi:hypothetical protein HKI87_19g89150 [Chloropicon roscoffensis]|uniref:MYB transcription factor n=1 Tax=Chloropicon roscoffensis TaxID=1461544 RepID=A0AAX4PNT3_9CHLO
MAVFKLSPARERKRCRTDLVSDSETEAVSEEEGKRPAMEVDSQLAARSQMRDTMEDTQPQTSGGGMSVVSIDEADAMRAKISALSADCAELEAKIMGAERRLPRLRVTWSLQEERTFIEAHSRLGNRWVEISKLLPGRDARSVTNHWYNALKAASKASPLRRYRVAMGALIAQGRSRDEAAEAAAKSVIEGDWSRVIESAEAAEAEVKVKEKVQGGSKRPKVEAENQDLPSSSFRQSRTRKVWSEQEDLAFVEAHKALGDNWGAIAERMPGRNYHSIYYHWNYILSRKSKSVLKDYRLRIEVERAQQKAQERGDLVSGRA